MRRKLFVFSILAFLVSATPAVAVGDECLECHGDRDSLEPVTPGKTIDSLFVSPDALKGSIHAELSCSDCHAMGAKEEDTAHYEEGGDKPRLSCAECHDDVTQEYYGQCVHGQASKESHPNAPSCASCHGIHQIKAANDPESLIAPANQPETCGACHASDEMNDNAGITKRRLVGRYKEGVHWKQIQTGRRGASCSDCHGSHAIRRSSDSDSMVTRINLLTTCAKCHPDIVAGYSTGSHGRTLLAGNLDVPNCTTCHGDHDIISLRAEVGKRNTFARTEVCIWCHGNDRMMARYSLDTSPVDSYLNDFHGLAQRGSAGTAATCADCHDPHHSLPQDHPQSRMHLSNRGAACGKCHGKTSDSFILSFTHKMAAEEPGHGITYWVAYIYIIVILVTIGGMLLHNAIIWMYFARKKLKYQRARGKIRRLSSFELGWHWVMLVAFTILTVTGFALSYSDSVWFKWLYDLGLAESTRSWLHRFFAVLLTADMAIFLGYTFVTKRGRRRWWVNMCPRWQDAKDLYHTMMFFLGRRKEKPVYDVFNYAEKVEYWALWWGTVVMILSGLILWFSELLPANSPPWAFNVARAIHFYEAILAASAIVVWHLYHTIWHPEEYPIGTSFITGRLTEHEAKERFTDKAIAEQLPTEPDEASPEALPEKDWMDEDHPAK